jgi:hypothetical protein
VGRVRFKIRDIMSPVYKEIEEKDNIKLDYHREVFPSENDISSIVNQSVISNSNVEEVNVEPAFQVNEPEIAEAQANALLTESESDEGEEGHDGENIDLMATNRLPMR